MSAAMSPTGPTGSTKIFGGSTAPAGAAGKVGAPRFALPPDMSLNELMSWLGNNLNKTDGDLRTEMKNIEKSKQHTADLYAMQQGLVEMLKTASDSHCPDAGGQWQEWGEAWAKEEDKTKFFSKTSPFNEMSQSTRDVVSAFMTKLREADGGGVDNLIDKKSLDALKDAIGNEITQNNSSNEMAMIKLQSSMAARGQLIQMISNMVASFDKTSEHIISKIG